MQGTFKEFFDANKLDERRRGEIEFVLNSPAYAHSFVPYMRGILSSLEKLARDRSQKRKDEYPDDFLFGGIAYGEGLMAFFEALLRETSMDRIHAAMEEMTSEELYDLKLKQGKVHPVVGLDQPALPQPVDPAEDF